MRCFDDFPFAQLRYKSNKLQSRANESSVVLIEKQGISKKLFKVAKLILVLPHSNAGEERVFSMVRKNKTTFRSSLSMEGTLSPILTVKLADVNAVKFKPPSELLKKAKGATWEYNKQHKRKK